jgi:CRISPR-associated protein Cmr4
MIKKSKLFFIIAETPLHPGSGGEVTGLVDLPIQRERHTNFPKIEASGLKGCIREAFENSNKQISLNSQQININDKKIISLVFGPEDTEEAHAGALAFTDARILLFPVKSLKGVFAWITCPMVLERFKEDLRLTGENFNYMPPDEIKEGNCWISDGSTIFIDDQIVLEEYTFKAEKKDEVKQIADFFAQKIFPQQQNDVYKFWREKLKKDLVILSDEDFEQFVTSSTEVITRTRINNVTGTVDTKRGGLWTEEYLPQDTIFYSIAMASPVRVEKDKAKGVFNVGNLDKEAEKVLQFFELGIPEVIQIGGNQTIGKGIVRIQILK